MLICLDGLGMVTYADIFLSLMQQNQDIFDCSAEPGLERAVALEGFV